MDRIAKAISGGVTALAGSLGTALADGMVTSAEYVTVVAATIVAFFAVWATRNAPADGPQA